MKKISTAAAQQMRNFENQKLTIGLDLGDRTSWYIEKNTADVKATRDVIVLYKDVPWETIFRLDESQNTLHIVTESTDES
jgi:hypothetical protein